MAAVAVSACCVSTRVVQAVLEGVLVSALGGSSAATNPMTMTTPGLTKARAKSSVIRAAPASPYTSGPTPAANRCLPAGNSEGDGPTLKSARFTLFVRLDDGQREFEHGHCAQMFPGRGSRT